MAIEKSIYEGKFDDRLSGFTCLGKITKVDAASRTCQVKTIGVKGRTHDLDLSHVQWISLSAAADGNGDEDTCFPRPGNMGVITFINSEPYIIGYYRPTISPPEDGQQDGTQDPNDTQEQLVNPGDRVIRTIAGNRVILRSGGTVEIESTKLCRTYWIPNKNLINTVCGDYELETTGGFMYWTRDPETDQTQLRYFVYDSLNPQNTMDLQIGTTDDPARFLQLQLGAAGDDDSIATPTFDLGVSPDGSTELNVGSSQQFHLKIDGASGDVEMTTQGKFTQTVQGDLTQSVQGNLDQSVQGDVTQTVEGKVDVKATGDAKVESQGNAILSGASGIQLDGTGGGGSGAALSVLVNPLALSDFTGAPIEPASGTVKASP